MNARNDLASVEAICSALQLRGISSEQPLRGKILPNTLSLAHVRHRSNFSIPAKHPRPSCLVATTSIALEAKFSSSVMHVPAIVPGKTTVSADFLPSALIVESRPRRGDCSKCHSKGWIRAGPCSACNTPRRRPPTGTVHKDGKRQ